MLRIGLLGTSFKKTNVDFLGKLFFDEAQTREWFQIIKRFSPIKELLILSTCNRVEWYYTSEDDEFACYWLRQFISRFFGLPQHVLDTDFYSRTGFEAVRHVSNVSTGLNSMVVGETEILGQIKKSLSNRGSL